MTADIEGDQRIVHEGKANIQRGWESVGGYLWLTEKQLIFQPHRVNAQRERIIISLNAIERVEPCWTRFLGIIPLAPNSFRIVLQSKEIHSFVVTGRSLWISAITSEMGGETAIHAIG